MIDVFTVTGGIALGWLMAAGVFRVVRWIVQGYYRGFR